MQSILHSPFRKLCGKGLCRLGRIAVHAAVDNTYTFFRRLVSAQHVIVGHHITCMLLPYRAVSAAYPGDFQPGKFLEGSLDSLSVFAYDIGVVTCHFILELGETAVSLVKPPAKMRP